MDLFVENRYFNHSLAEVVLLNSGWMTWNILLAWLPVVIFWIAFVRNPEWRTQKSLRWWSIIALGILFLPNSAYVVTDLIHLVDQTRFSSFTHWEIITVLVPQYTLFLIIGLLAHLVSLRLFYSWWAQQLKASPWIRQTATFALPLLLAYGIWLGRFPRFNSWEVFLPSFWPDVLRASIRIVHEPSYLWFMLAMYLFILLLNLVAWTRVVVNSYDAKSVYNK